MSKNHCLSVSEIAFGVLYQISEKCVNNKETLSDDDLINIHSLFGSVFERAAEIIEKKNSITFYSLENKVRQIIEVKGSADNTYKLLPNINYCPCPAFQFHVVNSKSDITCKHILATWLAGVTNKYTEQIVSQQQYLSIVCGMFMIDGSSNTDLFL